MELAVTVSTVGRTSATKINNFASNGGNYFCTTKKMKTQWNVEIIFVSQKKIILRWLMTINALMDKIVFVMRKNYSFNGG